MFQSNVRSLISQSRSVRGVTQRRWAQVHDVRFLASHQQPQHVLDKYKDKLDSKAKQEGYSDINALRKAYEQKAKQPQKPSWEAKVDSTQSKTGTDPSSGSTPPKSSPTVTNKDGVKTLSSFIDVEKTALLPADQIEQLWRLRHANNPQSLCATIPINVYRQLVQNAQQHPQFILPVPREGQGAEMHYMQWTFPSPTTTTVLFTHLAEFKLRGEFSQPHTTVTHHLDLVDSHGIVLMQGQVLPDRGVSPDESKWLLVCLQKFYGEHPEQSPRQRLLQQFSQGDSSFKVAELLDEAEKLP